MIRLTLSQMRKSVGRLVAAGVAIMIGTAFVAATLIAGATITRTSTDAPGHIEGALAAAERTVEAILGRA